MRVLLTIGVATLAACATEEILLPATTSIAGEWQLVSVESPNYNLVVPETSTPPVVRITNSPVYWPHPPSAFEGSISGTDQCNGWITEYWLPGEGRISKGGGSRTLVGCPRIYTLAEGAYTGVGLSGVTHYDRNGSTLVLRSADHTTKITFVQRP